MNVAGPVEARCRWLATPRAENLPAMNVAGPVEAFVFFGTRHEVPPVSWTV